MNALASKIREPPVKPSVLCQEMWTDTTLREWIAALWSNMAEEWNSQKRSRLRRHLERSAPGVRRLGPSTWYPIFTEVIRAASSISRCRDSYSDW